MATATLVTSEQFLALPDRFDASGNRIKEELIGGEIVPMAAASKVHDLVKNHIGYALRAHLQAHKELGLQSLIEIAYELADHDTFVPDVSVVRIHRLAEPGRILRGAPEIAIEVVSPSDTALDLKRKIKAYLENGARSVWVFYDDGCMMVHTTSQVRELTGEQRIEEPLLPGFAEPVSSFFTL